MVVDVKETIAVLRVKRCVRGIETCAYIEGASWFDPDEEADWPVAVELMYRGKPRLYVMAGKEGPDDGE